MDRKPNKPRDWAKRKRAELIEKLGGCCVHCGSTRRLEFDHLEPRTWIARNLSQWGRMTRYIREAAEGKIQLLCRRCNYRKGQPKLPEVSVEEPF
jgi:5-methylcytosine-specific restriction endonuclease McrA